MAAGKVLGVDAWVVGSVSHIQYRRGKTTMFIAWINKQEVDMSVDLCVVSVETGEILCSTQNHSTTWEREWVTFGFLRRGGIRSKDDLVASVFANAVREAANQLGDRAVKKQRTK